jgi:Caudovirus prohead serine protease
MISIRGYASSFAYVRVLDDGTHEHIAPNAFIVRNTDLRWGSHDDGAMRFATSADGSLQCFQDSYGLGFEADFPTTRHTLAILRAVSRLEVGASIAFASTHTEQWEADGVRRCRIMRGELDHVTLAGNVADEGAFVWLSDAHPVACALWHVSGSQVIWRGLRPAPRRGGETHRDLTWRRRRGRPLDLCSTGSMGSCGHLPLLVIEP